MAPKYRRSPKARAGDYVRRAVDNGVGPHAQLLERQLQELRAQSDDQQATLERLLGLVVAQRDNIPVLRHLLDSVRRTDEYDRLWHDDEPLISVRIATFNRAEVLVDRALPSVFAQSYPNFEVVIVGDACTDDTEQQIAKLNDPRVRYFELATGAPYPSDPDRRWLVGGVSAMNLGARLARGAWLAPLDDDDEFSPDHLEVLLRTALAERAELTYGRLARTWLDTGAHDYVGAYPPRLGDVTLQAAIYPRLLGFFELDPHSWLGDEPADWNFVRRMVESGVRVAYTDHLVGQLWTHTAAGRRRLVT